jgi:tetratricopeptide (TPR) repeat protein
MKNFLIVVLYILLAYNSEGQTTSYKPSPGSKHLEDSAIQLFTQSYDNKDTLAKVKKLLDLIIKKEPKYYGGWADLLTFLGRIGQHDQCIALAKKITQQFPNEPDGFVNYGVLLYTSGNAKESAGPFARALKLYENMLQKNKKSPIYNSILTQKAILLILNNNAPEGKKILRIIHDQETDPYKKSYLAFYINSDKETIINDRVPGK